MPFIRVKEFKGKYRYAYVVSNKWRKRLGKGQKGSRQKVSKYLGKVLTPQKEEKEFTSLSYKTKTDIVRHLVTHELLQHGFSEKSSIITKDSINFVIKDLKFENDNIVLEMNEGFLCNHTIRRLLNFRSNKEDERERGIDLAKSFLEAGLKVPEEVFVKFYEKVF